MGELELLEVKPSGGMVDGIMDTFKQQPMLGVALVMGLYMLYQNFAGSSSSAGKDEIDLKTAMAAEENTRVFFDIKIGDSEPERLEIMLFAKHVPKTAETFRALCTG